MTSSAVRRAFVRRVRALQADLSGALEDDRDALHRSRVASRRLREILPVLDVDDSAASDIDAARRRVRAVTRALGGVRALDVALGILDDLRDRDDAASTSVLDVVREDLIDERRRLRDKMGARVSEAEALALPEQLEAVAPGTQAGSDARRRAMLAERVTKRADRLEAAIDEAGALYAPERLHQVRIAAKQLRYALELVHEFGGVGTRRLTVRLKDVQDILGRLHDLEFVFSRIRRRSWPAGSEEAAGAARLLDMIEREIRERHADYLARLDGCRSVVTACRGAVAPRLAAARGRRRLARDDGHPGPVAPRRNR